MFPLTRIPFWVHIFEKAPPRRAAPRGLAETASVSCMGEMQPPFGAVEVWRFDFYGTPKKMALGSKHGFLEFWPFLWDSLTNWLWCPFDYQSDSAPLIKRPCMGTPKNRIWLSFGFPLIDSPTVPQNTTTHIYG